MLNALRGMPRTVWLIGAISLVNDSASEMLYPLIPLYLASVLMAGPRALGLIEGLAEATSSLLKLISGVIVDHKRRTKPWIVFGYGLAGLARPLTAFIASWPWLLVLRFGDRVGKGLRSSPRDTLLASSVDPLHRGLAFGLHRAMDNAGAVIGPLVAALLLGLHLPLRQIFLWSALPAVVCLGLALALDEPQRQPASHRPPPDWRLTGLPPVFTRYLAVVALFSLGNSSNLFLLLRAKDLGMPDAQIPLLWAAVSAVATLFSTPLSALSDRLGRSRMLAVGYGAYAVIYAWLGRIQQGGPSLFLLFACYGIFMAATEGVEKAVVADLAPTGRRGSAYGWFNLVTGVMILPASLIFGWLYHSASPATAFSVAAGCSGLAAAGLLGWVRLPASRSAG